jgi:hypothetical protein
MLTLAALLAAILPSAARAADTHAPKGARADWLPSSEWVMSSWLPYDEARLYRLLHVDRATLSHWLDDRRPLGALARRHGVKDLRAFAARLVMTREVSPAQRRVLRDRALETLTQAHLARHVYFHIFHTPAIPNDAPAIFGISPQRFRALRTFGASPQGIAARSGIGPQLLLQRLDRLFVARGDRAVRVRAMSRRQADALLAEQREQLALFIRRPYRTLAQQATFACSLHVY